MMVPGSDGVSRQVSIRLWHVYAIALIFISLVFASLFLASSYFVDRVDEAEIARLTSENEQLSEKYENLRWTLAEADDRYDHLVQKEIALRNVFGLEEISPEERQLGIGGPPGYDASQLSETERLAYSTESQVDRLLSLSSYELEKFDEAEQALMNLKDRLDHTPSIQPTRGWCSRGYGQKQDPFTGYKRMHRGLDIANHNGTPIIAPADGVVKSIAKNGALGTTLTIDHGYGYVTRYGHLSKVTVKRGQRVSRGDEIAKMGNTGRSTGSHLHYEVWRNGEVLNPAGFILNDQ